MKANKYRKKKDCLCISPGEWLNESEEASDRECREAALLALRVTGPSRTGGCKYTQRQTNINILTLTDSRRSALLGSSSWGHLELRNQILYSLNSQHTPQACFTKQGHRVTWIPLPSKIWNCSLYFSPCSTSEGFFSQLSDPSF